MAQSPSSSRNIDSGPTIRLNSVSEHDVDLLVVEELAGSTEFASWLMRAIGIDDARSVIAVEHSVSTANGESDLEIALSGKPTCRILIENKVDAEFQPRQVERYRERAERYLSGGVCGEAKIVLLAPESYIRSCGRRTHFDATVSLEQLRDAIQRFGGEPGRVAYKLALLERALERGASGWTRVVDSVATEFYRSYSRLVDRISPELNMRGGDEGKPAGSAWIYFKPSALRPGIDLVHKIPKGHVDLQFAGKGAQISQLRTQLLPHLEGDMAIAQAHKSAVVRIRVSPTDFPIAFPQCEPTMETAIRSASRLLAWYSHLERSGAIAG